MNKLRKVFTGLLLGLCLVPNYSFGQQLFSRTFSYSDGLPSQTIYFLHSEPNGLLYLGTESGLYTFDGLRFKPIENPEGVTRPITDLQKDKFGRLWARNFSGQLFCLINDTLRTFDQIQKHSNLDLSSFEFVVHDRGVYLGNTSGLHFFDFETQKLSSIYKIPKSENDPGYCEGLHFDEKGKFFYLTIENNGYAIDLQGKLLKHFTFEGNNKRQIVFDGQLLSLAKGFPQCFESISEKGQISSKIKGLSDRTTISYWVEIENELWISTSTGLHRIFFDPGRVSKSYFENYRVSHAIKDAEGNLWIGTLDHGLFMVPSMDIIYRSFSSEDSQSITFVSLLVIPDKTIVAGTIDGQIFILNSDGSYRYHFDSGASLPIEFLKYIKDSNKVLFNYGEFSLDKIPPKLTKKHIGKYLSYDKFNNQLISSPGNSMLLLKDSNSVPNTFENYPIFQKIDEGRLIILAEGRSRTNFYDKVTNSYWFGTDAGLFVFQEQGKKEIKLNNRLIVAKSILQKKDGSIWVGTASNGLVVIKNDTISETISTKDGLSGSLIKQIIADKAENIYVLTDKGLNFISKNTNSIWNITQNLGLRGMEINNFELSEKNIILSINSGIISFPISIGFETKIPTITIDHVKHLGVIYPIEEFSKKKLKRGEIDFKFKSINHRTLGDYTYEYRLLGFQDKWQTIPARNDILQFISLPAGNYILEAKSKVNGLYSPTIQVKFTVIPPFWQTNMFMVAVTLVFLLFVYFFTKLIINKLRIREDLKVKLALSQITALRAQMSPHFIFNVLNTVQGMIYGGQKSEASDLLGKFSELMRNTLDSSGRKTTLLRKEIDHLQTYIELEKQRFDEDDFEFKIHIDQILELDSIEVPSMILQPFVENAVKHGLLHKVGRKKLDISFQHFEKNALMVEIDDNGIGRKAATAIRDKRQIGHKSFATSSIQQRIELMNKLMEKPIRLQVVDKKNSLGKPTGTKILIVIPYESNFS